MGGGGKPAARLTLHVAVITIPAILSGIFAAPAIAQTKTGSEIERIEEEERERRRRAKAAGAAEERRLVEDGGGVTFQEILDDPDNLKLNFRFAKSQIDSGDLKGASATLERMLLINPELAEIRVYYGLVLLRLDNLDEAERAFRDAAEGKLPADLRAKVEGYLSEIETRRKRFRANVQLNLGAHYDWNRNAASDTDKNLVLDSRLDLDSSDQRQYDWATTGVLSTDFSYDLGFQAPHQFVGSFTYYHDEQMGLEQLDTKAGTVRGGLRLVFPRVTVTPSAFLSITSLSHERFYRGRGGKLRLDHRVTRNLDVFASAQFTDTKYDVLFDSTSSALRSGHRWDWDAGFSFAAAPSHRLSARYRHTANRARENYLEYASHEIDFSHSWVIGGGQFLTTSLGWRRVNYRDNDSAVSAKRRNDTRVRARATYGMPVSNLIPDTDGSQPIREAVNGWVWTFSGEFLVNYSNIINYQYRNRRFQSMLMRRWAL